MLMTCEGTGVVFTRYCASAPIPSFEPDGEETTSKRLAPGATPPARITSSVASSWPPSVGLLPDGGAVRAGPGSMPPYAVGMTSVGLVKVAPVLLLKLLKSAEIVRAQLTIPIVTP